MPNYERLTITPVDTKGPSRTFTFRTFDLNKAIKKWYEDPADLVEDPTLLDNLNNAVIGSSLTINGTKYKFATGSATYPM